MQFLLINQFTFTIIVRGSATTSVNQYVFDTVTVYQEIIRMVKKEFPRLQPELNNREYWSYITVYDKLIFANNKQFTEKEKEYRRWILKHKKEIMKDQYFTKFRKIAIVFLSISPILYKKIVELKK